MSLPEFGGMDTGFNPYHGADPFEYDLVVTNSEGGIPRLLELGARRAESLFWAADPEFFAPQPVEKSVDVFFYGYGDKFRRDWMKTLIGEPSRVADELEFALGGLDFLGDTGNAQLVGDVPFNVFARAISAARVNVNMTRRPHATVPARPPRGPSSSRRRAPPSSRTRTRASTAGSSPAASSSSSRPRRRRSPPTASWSQTPHRPRRWGGARASASSTSTRTRTGPGACSSSSESTWRRP